APATIYDIGAYRGGWTRLAREVFPAAQFVLFEANADHAAELARAGQRHVVAALGAEDGGAKPVPVPRRGDGAGASPYVENTAHYAAENLEVRELATARLDTVMARERLARPDLIKIDVQGAELDVLAGATQTLQSASALIVEVSLIDYNRNAPLIADVMAGVERHGFKCADLCVVHRTGAGFVLQLDLLFARPPLFAKFRAAAGVS